jgi:transposase InsO family protein
MKYKSEVVGIFWQFKKNVENNSSCRIQAIRLDNGKEYTSSEFNLYCEEASIEHQFITPYTLK